MKIKFISLLAIVIFIFQSCDNDDPKIYNSINKSEVIKNYANLVFANYEDAISDARLLKKAIDEFVADPTEAKFTAAKKAWKISRESYGPSEAFRFADGPIDIDDDAPEALLNAWPLDEVFIDYVEGNATSGIINDLSITIDKSTLTSLSGALNSEANVAIGYHAIEFLLWGQDLTSPSEKLSGQRPFTDFVDGKTAKNQGRRRDYLAVCADVLIDHLQLMIEEWKIGGDYRNTFLALDQTVALKNMLKSIAELASSELAVERMSVAYDKQDQEDEHSCFSDNTHRDIRLNIQGVVNVYKGSYGTISGPSLEDLIKEKDAKLGAEISALLAVAVSTIDATAIPFDYAITNKAERPKILIAFNALKKFGRKLLDGGNSLGLQ